MLDRNALVVVADGEKARIFRNIASHGVSLGAAQVMLPGDLADQGPAGAVPPGMTGKEQMEATFAKMLVQHLNGLALKNAFPQLVLFADPQTLGQMRPLYHKELQKRLVKDEAKTLSHATPTEIEAALS